MPDRPRNAYLILGLVRRGADTGYTVKAVVDRFARFFWAVSYGQLYPELKRLHSQKLLRSRQEKTGGRRRTAYTLTKAGERELEAWLDSDGEMLFEVRIEAFMKLFVSESSDQQKEIIRRLRSDTVRTRDTLAAIEPPRPIGRHLKAHGLQMYDSLVEWCDEMESAIAEDRPPKL
jgi:DNA-binding PadR family transcriptional regulator